MIPTPFRPPFVQSLSKHFQRSFAARAGSSGKSKADGETVRYTKWLEGDGLPFKQPKRGPNWLGGDVPFPMNPSFSPPPPLSNATRDQIYAQFLVNPDLRSLSSQFGISLKRLDAILRLKGLERSWTKEGKELQTGFLFGMEQMLGSSPAQYKRTASVVESEEADKADADSASNRIRNRYQRLFWEPVVDGMEPVVSSALEQTKAEAKVARLEQLKEKNSVEILTGRKRTTQPLRRPKVFLVKSGQRENSPMVRFEDVGGKFVDLREERKRLQEIQRKKIQRAGARGRTPGRRR